MSVSGSIPDELAVEILSRISAKSLMRFKAVSKPWGKLVRDPEFIHKHKTTRASITRGVGTRFLIVRYSRRLYGPVFSIINVDFPKCEYVDIPCLGNNIDVDDCLIRASLDGLVLFTHAYPDVYLWNPATRDLRLFPDFTSNFPDHASYCFGLGFDSSSKDYKVVRIATFTDERNEYVSKAEVCAVTAGSWRVIATNLPLPIGSTWNQMYLGGKCYFKARNIGDMEALVSFDMTDETFEVIALPSPWTMGIRSEDDHWKRILEVEGSIALVSSNLTTTNGEFREIWMINKSSGSSIVGVDGQMSLSKFITLDSSFEGMIVLFITKKGELLLNDFPLLCICNIRAGELKNSGIRMNPAYRFFAYDETLVSVKALC